MGRVIFLLFIIFSENGKSGEYWIKIGISKQKLYCDMEVDSGGWTLFFNYLHYPGSDLKLNENKLPSSLKVNSHMYLDNAGFRKADVKEIRFLCSEKDKKSEKGHFWHFKTDSEDLINVAFDGNQKYLKV